MRSHELYSDKDILSLVDAIASCRQAYTISGAVLDSPIHKFTLKSLVEVSSARRCLLLFWSSDAVHAAAACEDTVAPRVVSRVVELNIEF